jgi:hypothetical protein
MEEGFSPGGTFFIIPRAQSLGNAMKGTAFTGCGKLAFRVGRGFIPGINIVILAAFRP